MSIQDDLNTIKQLQDDFKVANGAYFEMDWSPAAGHQIDIPSKTDILNLQKMKRFIGGSATSPNKEIKEINFAPTAKNFRFLIGRGIRLDSKAEVLLSDYWYCKAHQMDSGKLVEHFIEGGDLSMSVTKGN